MDKTIRRNDICVIGMPRCDFVFSSARSCFIAYGFKTSKLETDILRRLLEERSIDPLEAGGIRAPGEHAFCKKICSKIITSQFCIVLLNHDDQDGHAIPNPNVNMEYGLMLGFNKYVIPFQREEEELPFNVAALDTIKYTNQTFEQLATEAIDQAIAATLPDETKTVDINQKLNAFMLSRETIVAPVDTEGDRAIYQLGSPLGFNLLNDFSGIQYTFLGNFTHLRPETVVWRARTLERSIDGRRSSWPLRVQVGAVTEEQVVLLDKIFEKFDIWLVVNTDADKEVVEAAFKDRPQAYKTVVYSLNDIDQALDELGGAAG